MRLTSIILLTLAFASAAPAAPKVDVSKLVEKSDEWFKSDEGRQILSNILTWQNANGGWWKAYDPTSSRPPARSSGEGHSGWERTSTFDNKATYSELRVLAHAYRVTGDPAHRDAFNRGLKFVFDAQYGNGGWPQRFPLDNNYGRHITYNDGAMTGVMNLLKDIVEAKPDFVWLASDVCDRASKAFDRGVECILSTQIRVNGKLTAWCQQHDEKTLAPAAARAYELPCITASESCDVVLMLMRIDPPSERVETSIRAAVEWLRVSQINGKRVEDRPDPVVPKKKDRVVVDDPNAPPLWARCYDIETNRPFFCGRDGVKKWSLDQIDRERRTGYAWLRPFATKVLAEYPKWDARQRKDRARDR
jgi:PelA/Pel-15E family pectate lyase